MHNQGKTRFFVTVSARKADDLRRLQAHGLDLFAPTARRLKGKIARPFVIEGLLDEAEIKQLKAEGYAVQVDVPAADRSVKPGDTLEFEPWLEHVQALAAHDRRVK